MTKESPQTTHLTKKKIRIIALLVIGVVAVFGTVYFNQTDIQDNAIQEVKELPFRIEQLPLDLEVVEKQGMQYLQGAFTNHSAETINKLTVEIALKDLDHTVRLQFTDKVTTGQTSGVSETEESLPQGIALEDLTINLYKISLENGTYMEYDALNNQYNWS